MTERDQTIKPSANGNRNLPERLAAFDDFVGEEEQPADVATGLVSLSYIAAAVRRGLVFWCALAIAGLLIGLGVFVKSPPAYHASTSMLLTYGPEDTPTSAVLDSQAIAESRETAQLAMNKLGLKQSVGSFAAAYTVTVVTNRVLDVNVSAPSSQAAVQRANAIAAAFLELRAQEMQQAQALVLRSVQAEVSQARQQTAQINAQISQVSSQPSSPTRRNDLKNLRNQLTQADATLSALQQTEAGTQASTMTLQAIKGSTVLDAATPQTYSRAKYALLYGLTGLFAGLVIGLGIVVVRAIASDRLRRRDDVARALGAPIGLSLGPIRLHRWRRDGRGLAAAERPDVQRIVAHLRSKVTVSNRSTANLAVVPVDDSQVAAVSLIALATALAQEGKRVVLADLTSGTPIAKLLGSESAGIQVVNVSGIQLMLAVPEAGEVAPLGPLGRRPIRGQVTEFSKEAKMACASADVVLTLATLDPGFGGDYLKTWAAHAVAMVTAGRSSWTRIHAVGELVRLSGVALVSAVLVGADKADESLGLASGTGELVGFAELS